ncbi:ABC transporter ATP-binding protein [Chloroflexi bacterium TSY]|nr:ABC transporter ATP-binding protein [Chloroflexi bacterium TSY]
MSNLLELQNVTKVFKGGTIALDDISFHVNAESPSIIAVAGESGKTTLGLMSMGFLDPSEGQILYAGQDIHNMTRQQRFQFRHEVQAVFQDPFAVYNPFYKVDHILEVPLANFKLAKSKKEGKQLIEEALESVGLRPGEILGRFPHQLSGGQRQRMVVARALLLKPKLLIADELVSMVDASLRATILETLHALNREHNITILYITHDLTTAYHVSDHIIILYKGSVMEAGDVEQVITNPQHPYTQLLIDSIPWPDLNQQWGQQEIIAVDGESAETGIGCKFAPRCPHAMPQCRQSPPPLYQLEGKQVASCYLYEDQSELAREELGTLFGE